MKKIIVFGTTAFLILMTALSLFTPSEEMSVSERRKLKQFPELSVERILSGKFMGEFEEYAADQFPMRETWRSIKANLVTTVFRQSENNDLYYKDGHLAKIEYPLNEDSLRRAAGIFKKLYTEQMEGKNCNVYFSLIPDKNYFLGYDHLQMDYERLTTIMCDELEMMTYIDIFDLLDVNNYYRTDTHWRQEDLLPVAERLVGGMGGTFAVDFEVEESGDVRTDDFETVQIEEPFYGVYYGQAALNVAPDKMSYLTNKKLENCVVYDHQNDKEISMYDMSKLEGNDPYEMFLGGPLSLITIKNLNVFLNSQEIVGSSPEKELIIFRDSFGSSIAPLMIDNYSKVTLVDIRYLASALVGNYVDFENADVLFLYSTSVLNHSETIK